MKSLLTVSGVVFAHICVFLLLVNGCRGPESASSGNWNQNTGIYSGGAHGADAPASARPAAATPAASAESEPAAATPAEAKPAASAPASATPAKAVSAEPKKNAESAPASEEKIYRVQKGDVLSTIAIRYGVTAKELADANGIALNSVLQIGQALKIPAAKAKATEEKAATDGDVYVVKKGDALSKIAQTYKVSVKQIKAANNLKSDNIRVGQKLVIPSKDVKKAEAPKQEEAAPTTEAPKPEAAPAQAQPVTPAKDDAVPAESVPADDNFGMPEGGFGSLLDDEVPATQPEESAPAESVPASAVPVTDTPAK